MVKIANNQPIRIPESNILRTYPGDLTETQNERKEINTEFVNDDILKIFFVQFPDFDVTIRRQDIFKSNAQVIVNAANSHLGGGGGIDGAIHRKGGEEYANAHRNLKNIYDSNYPLGHASMITSGQLKKFKIKNVIVVAGPQQATTPDKENELYSCYYNSLVLAAAQKITSIAFPAISTGLFGFPKDRAASISMRALRDFIGSYPDTTLKTISIHFLPSDPRSVLETYSQSQTENL